MSDLFLDALGADMTAMEEYFPFVTKAYTTLQYTSYAVLLLIVLWQVFRAFGGPLTEAENPLTILGRFAIFALLIGEAKPIFLLVLDFARAPYTTLMDISMTAADFTFTDIEQSITKSVLTIFTELSGAGTLLILILLLSIGWNYIKLLLETVERYILVGVLCYTSPLAYCMGGSKATNAVFKSWCRMVGSQLLMLVMNVWFLRGFSSSAGRFCRSGGELSNGHGSMFLWLFCVLAFLKCAQKFDSYLSSLGLNVAQTGSSMGMEMMAAARMFGGKDSGPRSAGSVFGGGASKSIAGGASSPVAGFVGSFMNRFRPGSYVRDAVTTGGIRMGFGGAGGFIARSLGGAAAFAGASLTGREVASVAARDPINSGSIGGKTADRSLSNYMPHLAGRNLTGTQITGGHISTKSIGADGKETDVELFSANQFERPDGQHRAVTASDGSQWYQMASGPDAGSFVDTPAFLGSEAEASRVAEMFPDAPDGTTLRTVGEGAIEATTPDGTAMWLDSGVYAEPNGSHSVVQGADGSQWYAMEPYGEGPHSGPDGISAEQFQAFMPAYTGDVNSVSELAEGRYEVRHGDGSATMFYDSSRYAEPRGEYLDMSDASGHNWYAVNGEAVTVNRPLVIDGEEVEDDKGNLVTFKEASVRYATTPSRNGEPKRRSTETRTPRRKR